MLTRAERPLTDLHDLVVLDLDGVVYIGGHGVPHAAEALTRARDAGQRLAYVTNNAARTPDEVCTRLRGIGMPVEPGDVVTSAQAAARLLAERLEAGSQVFVIGGEGLEQALVAEGLAPVTTAGPEVVAVAQGYGPEMPWKQVIEGAILVRDGLLWVASNTDMTIPTAHGVGPGNGTLVKLVADYAGRAPLVAGKPETPLLAETLERVGGSRPLMVGDRLDTDIEGARRVGWDSLLVLTGVTDLPALVAAQAHERPSYIGRDLRDLHEPHPAPTRGDDGWSAGGWVASETDGRLRVSGGGSDLDWWRAVAAAAWEHLDNTGSVVDVSAVSAPR